MTLRASTLPAKCALIGSVATGLVGSVVGLVVGLRAHPATAWFAIFELGIPSALFGGLVGVVIGTIASGVAAHAGGDTAQRRAHPIRTEPVWPDVVVALGVVAVLYALWSMDWASRVDDLGRTTFENGPTRVLAFAGLASLALSLIVVVARWRWPRWFLLAATLTTAVAAVVVALCSIDAANHTFEALGETSSGYEPGAVVGVGTAFTIAGFALVGFNNAYAHADQLAARVQSPASDEAS